MEIEIQTTLLVLIGIFYCAPILYVCCHYSGHKSISHITYKNNIQYIVLYLITLLTIFIIPYELLRTNSYSILFVICMMIGIFGCMIYKRLQFLHYVYAGIGCLFIVLFMLYHSIMRNDSVLYTITIIELLLYISMIIYFNDHIFYNEFIFLFLFGVFYVYLHKLVLCKIPPCGVFQVFK
jgi:hypothetical protein